MAQGVRKLAAVARIGGEFDSLEQLFGELAERGADAVAVVGDRRYTVVDLGTGSVEAATLAQQAVV
jgi:hypothetical protein